MAVPGTVRTVGMLLEPELLQQVQEAAAAHGATSRPGCVMRCGRSPLRTFQKAGVQE